MFRFFISLACFCQYSRLPAVGRALCGCIPCCGGGPGRSALTVEQQPVLGVAVPCGQALGRLEYGVLDILSRDLNLGWGVDVAEYVARFLLARLASSSLYREGVHVWWAAGDSFPGRVVWCEGWPGGGLIGPRSLGRPPSHCRWW